jgi:outer membrane protein TolC
MNKAEVGFSQMTRFGLAGQLTFGETHTNLLSSNPMVISTSDFFDVGPSAEITFPLWKNLFGKQYRELENAQNASASAVSIGKQFEVQTLLLDAEVKYWKLAAVRENIGIITHNVERTKEILAFNTLKYKRRLVDINEVLQAQAELKARELDLRIALNEEREAMREFNTIRKIDSAVVDDHVLLPDVSTVLERLKQTPQRAGVRNDVKAAEQNSIAVRANAEASRERTKPDVNLFAMGSLTGQDPNFSRAAGNSFNTDHSYYAAGVKLSVPLDFWQRSTIRDGYSKESVAAESVYQQKLFDQDTGWKNLLEKLKDYYERLQLSEEVRKAQLEKFEKERERQREGKSSTFQVFIFEEEYLAAQIRVVQAKTSSLALLAQAKLYESGALDKQ